MEFHDPFRYSPWWLLTTTKGNPAGIGVTVQRGGTRRRSWMLKTPFEPGNAPYRAKKTALLPMPVVVRGLSFEKQRLQTSAEGLGTQSCNRCQIWAAQIKGCGSSEKGDVESPPGWEDLRGPWRAKAHAIHHPQGKHQQQSTTLVWLL